MSDLEPVPADVDLIQGEAALSAATLQLRAVTSPRAVEIADRVLARTLATPRPSRLVRARAPHDHLRVSTTALITTLREHLDSHLVDAAVGRVVLDVDDAEHLSGITVELYVRYGTDVLATADRARALAGEALTRTLGAPAPDGPEDPVVSLSHIHVSDVTRADPHLVDPTDE